MLTDRSDEMTSIKLKAPNGYEKYITKFEMCLTTRSISDRAGSFSVTAVDTNSDLVDAFPYGSEIEIIQAGNIFRGWVSSTPKSLNRELRLVSFEGSAFSTKTKKIVVTESYEDEQIDYIVFDLFDKYAPWVDTSPIEECQHKISYRFNDEFLWDAMNRLAEISGYQWYIDDNKKLHFFQKSSRVNPLILNGNNYVRGSARFDKDSTRLVNKLWVKGAKTLSDPHTDYFPRITPESVWRLKYKPDLDAGITVLADGAPATLGIYGEDNWVDFDFMYDKDYNALLTSQSTASYAYVTYQYRRPLKFLLEDPGSQDKYGVFEDILNVETEDRVLARDFGIRYISKFANPVLNGTIQPIIQGDMIFREGELIKIEIPHLKIDEFLQIKQVTLESVAGTGRVNCTLQLETPERDAEDILKELNNRLKRLERTVFNDEDGLVEAYEIVYDKITVPYLRETTSIDLHQYHLVADDLYCSDDLYV